MNNFSILKIANISYLLLIFTLYILNIISYSLFWNLSIPGLALSIFILRKTKTLKYSKIPRLMNIVTK